MGVSPAGAEDEDGHGSGPSGGSRNPSGRARTARARPPTRPLADAPSPGARAFPGRRRAEASGARQVGGHERHAAQQVLPRVLPAPGNKAFPLSALLSVGVTRHERQVNTPGGGCDHTPRGWCDECCQPAPPAPRAGPTRRYSGTPTTPTSTPTTPTTTRRTTDPPARQPRTTHAGSPLTPAGRPHHPSRHPHQHASTHLYRR